MNVLVLNSGSSSIKYEVFVVDGWQSIAAGLLERIGDADSRLEHQSTRPDGTRAKIMRASPIANHREGIDLIRRVLEESDLFREPGQLTAIGHRVVHGGEIFREPTPIDEKVIEQIRAQIPLAPLHNPAAVSGIDATRPHFPDVPQVAVFDTAFHQSIPKHAYRYAIPHELYQQHRVRRYGFHGTSVNFVSKQAATYLGQPHDQTNLIVLHLGNGASATAIAGGKSVDTSMGMTPLEGLAMGTRSGDIDPAIIFYLARETDRSIEQIETMLNKQSGMKGLCGENDMREILARASWGDDDAQLAVDVFCYRVKKYIGAFFAVLERVDAVVFTAGIGENAPHIRRECCLGLDNLGIEIDEASNVGSNDGRFSNIAEIQSDASDVKVLVVPTNEELEIAQQTVTALSNQA